MKKRVVVFGIFDGVHEGHRSLFAQAKQRGDELIAIIGRDSASLKWKGKQPKHPEEVRQELVSKEEHIDRAVLGDEEQSSYGVLQELNPDSICLGYDQEVLKKDLQSWMEKKKIDIPIYTLQPYHPDTYHNSLLDRDL